MPGALGAPDLQPEPRGPGGEDELEPLPMERFRGSEARRGRPLCSNRPIPWTVPWEPFPVSVGSSRRGWTACKPSGVCPDREERAPFGPGSRCTALFGTGSHPPARSLLLSTSSLNINLQVNLDFQEIRAVLML